MAKAAKAPFPASAYQVFIAYENQVCPKPYKA
jgi:hypothetical protein